MRKNLLILKRNLKERLEIGAKAVTETAENSLKFIKLHWWRMVQGLILFFTQRESS